MSKTSKAKEKKRLRSSNSSTGEVVDDSQIIEKLISIQDRIENGFTKINEEIAALKLELKNDIKSVREDLNEATKSLNAVWEEVTLLQEKNKTLQQQLDSTTEENAKLKEDLEAVRVRMVKQEDYSRRENLRFYNIPESAQETNEECIQKVKQVLSDLGAPSDIKFHAIHRTGKPNTNSGASSTLEGEPRPRPILARFVSRMDSESIWFKRKELRKSSRFATVSIDKDLSPESARERAKLRVAYRKAKELNIEKVFIKGKNLIINSSKYSVNTLPEYLVAHQDGSNN